MKVALCFIISYEHILNKEQLWREWIEPNKDIINVYFYYKDYSKIKSKWIAQHSLPPSRIFETSYFHVVPAYISLLEFAMHHDPVNKWFCMLTDSCCPIISPTRFRYLFQNNSEFSIFSWKAAWWNPYFHKRGNLAKLPKEFRLANDPWFILSKENVKQVMYFINNEKQLTRTICNGGIANETLFAVIFKMYNVLDNENSRIKCAVSHLADWSRQSSPTSPHLFKEANDIDKKFIERELERNQYGIFIRKVAPEFPDDVLKYYIYEYNKEKDDSIIINETIKEYIIAILYTVTGCFCLYVLYFWYSILIY